MDVRVGARKALARMLEPLTSFVFDSGLSFKELKTILRTAAVHSAAARQLKSSHRINISGISASTGISRAEISKILRAKPNPSNVDLDRHQHSINKILAAWHQDPRFNDPSGQPADLKIFGRGPTFESLAKVHGKGIPIRAMLDELTRTQAIELRASQVIRLKTSVVVHRGITNQIVKAFGDRVTELMLTLLQNMRDPENPSFIASVPRVKVSPKDLPLIRREMFSKGAEFLSQMQDVLVRRPAKTTVREKDFRSLSVTVYFCEEPSKPPAKQKNASTRRRNFHRK